jgi:TrmH family RNA methyltransferase
MTEIVTSPHNQLVKTAAALRRKKYREELGLFAIEGVRLAEEMVAAGWPAEICLFTAAAADKPRAAKMLSLLEKRRCRLIQVPDAVYDKITDTQEPQGFMLIAPPRKAVLADILSRPAPALIAVLDDVRDPGNAGTVIRAADAAGCSGVILLKGCADLYAGKTIRATMGSLFHLPVVEGVSRNKLISTLAAAAIPLAAATLDGAVAYTAADLTGPVAVVFGNEGEGVSGELVARATARIAIPIYGKAESLNVATAAAVILYEAARQRRSTL